MSLMDLGLIASIGAVALFSFFRKLKDKSKNLESTHDLFNYEKIYNNGLVELPGNQFRLVMEVEPINMALKSQQEQAATWVSFRSLLNSLNLPISIIIQSRELDIKDFIAKQREYIGKAKTPEIKRYGEKMISDIENQIKEQKIMSKSYYIVIKLDAEKGHIENADPSSDGGIGQIVASIQQVFSKIHKKQQKQEADTVEISQSELENMASTIMELLSGMEIKSRPLNKVEVEDFIYSAISRDLAPHSRLKDMYSSGSFNLTPVSLTPYTSPGMGGSETENDQSDKKTKEEAG